MVPTQEWSDRVPPTGRAWVGSDPAHCCELHCLLQKTRAQPRLITHMKSSLREQTAFGALDVWAGLWVRVPSTPLQLWETFVASSRRRVAPILASFEPKWLNGAGTGSGDSDLSQS